MIRGRDQGPVSLSAFAYRRDGFSSDPPVVRFNFVNDDEGRTRLLSEHVLEQLGNSLNKFLLLLGGHAVLGDPDVYIRHMLPPFRHFRGAVNGSYQKSTASLHTAVVTLGDLKEYLHEDDFT